MKQSKSNEKKGLGVKGTVYFKRTFNLRNPWPARSPLRVHPDNYIKGTHKQNEPPPSPSTCFLRGRQVTLDQGEEREVRCWKHGRPDEALRLGIHPEGKSKNSFLDPPSGSLDLGEQLKLRTDCCSEDQGGRHFRVYLWIEDEHGVIIYRWHHDLGHVSASRRKKGEESPRQEDSNADTDVYEGLAQVLDLTSDQNPSNPEPGPVELTGSTATSPAAGTPPNNCLDWNPPIFASSPVANNSSDDYNYNHNSYDCTHNNNNNNNDDDYNSYAAPCEPTAVAPYPQPNVVQHDPLALPASAPPQGEAACEDEAEVEFDTDQFLN